MTKPNHSAARRARLLRAMESDPPKPVVRWSARESVRLQCLNAFALGTLAGLVVPVALAWALYAPCC